MREIEAKFDIPSPRTEESDEWCIIQEQLIQIAWSRIQQVGEGQSSVMNPESKRYNEWWLRSMGRKVET